MHRDPRRARRSGGRGRIRRRARGRAARARAPGHRAGRAHGVALPERAGARGARTARGRGAARGRRARDDDAPDAVAAQHRSSTSSLGESKAEAARNARSRSDPSPRDAGEPAALGATARRSCFSIARLPPSLTTAPEFLYVGFHMAVPAAHHHQRRLHDRARGAAQGARPSAPPSSARDARRRGRRALTNRELAAEARRRPRPPALPRQDAPPRGPDRARRGRQGAREALPRGREHGSRRARAARLTPDRRPAGGDAERGSGRRSRSATRVSSAARR